MPITKTKRTKNGRVKALSKFKKGKRFARIVLVKKSSSTSTKKITKRKTKTTTKITRKIPLVVNNSTQQQQQPYHIYVLELEGGYIYVGKATDIKVRLEEHMHGQGAHFTKKYKPTGRLLKRLGSLEVYALQHDNIYLLLTQHLSKIHIL